MPDTLTRQLRRLALLPDAPGMTDAQLLACYLNHGDEAAFEVLLRRHAPMVLGVCRRILHHPQDAEDAFQATFLVFIRKAASLRSPDLLGNWLYGVAYRTAWRARARLFHRQAVERPLADVPSSNDAPDSSWRELADLLDAELRRLPDRYRAAVALCDLQGTSRKQAAHLLQLPEGTLSSRLSRGRDLLRKRLARRGLSLSVAALVPLLTHHASAAVPLSLITLTTESALLFLTNPVATTTLAPHVASLAKGVLKSMSLTKLKSALVLCTTSAVVCLTTGWLLHETLSAESAPRPALLAQAPPPPAASAAPPAQSQPSAPLKYGDGQPDGKKSLAGSGHLITFTLPSDAARVSGLRIHASRYGLPEPPKEKFLIYFLGQDLSEILHTELAPYSLFKRGSEQWVTVKFPRPIQLFQTNPSPAAPPTTQFWLALDFRPHRTKGVYLSYDTDTAGKFSRVGLPGLEPKPTDFSGDWMIEVLLAK